MKDYLLFLDTETSGIPKKWNLGYDHASNWPYVVQLGWIVYDKYANEIKRNVFYIYDKDIVLDPSSIKVHGITTDILVAKGKGRKMILRKLAYDIQKYDPLIVGHFLEFDLHVLLADYYRSKLQHPFYLRSFFCTMRFSARFMPANSNKYMRLAELHEYLLGFAPDKIHDAQYDAETTARCFFELYDKKIISEQDIDKQQSLIVSQLHIKHPIAIKPL